MDQRIRDLVRDRARNACEYCRVQQVATPLIRFHIEHIRARQHGGADDPAGLALARDRCNAHKGPNLASVDPDTGAAVSLFNPREDSWEGHFIVREGLVFGLTPRGRATVRLLNMNAARRVELRRAVG